MIYRNSNLNYQNIRVKEKEDLKIINNWKRELENYHLKIRKYRMKMRI